MKLNSQPLELKKVFIKVLGDSVASIQDSDSPETIIAWDSFQSLILMQEFEKAAGVSFSIDDLKQVKNVGDIKRLLEKYGVKFL